MTNPNDPIESVTMMKISEDGYRPARPNERSDFMHQSTGLTKREYFAALAMQGILSGLPTNKEITPQLLAAESIMCADALIIELNKQ